MSRTLKKVSTNVRRDVVINLLAFECFTQAQIAELVGMSQSTISKIKKEMDNMASTKEANNTPLFQFIKAPNSAISR